MLGWKCVYCLIEITSYLDDKWIEAIYSGGKFNPYASCLCFIDCSTEIVDFTIPSGNHSSHPKLFHWVKTYFEKAEQSKSLPTTTKSCEITVQGSSQSSSAISSSSKCNITVDDDAISYH